MQANDNVPKQEGEGQVDNVFVSEQVEQKPETNRIESESQHQNNQDSKSASNSPSMSPSSSHESDARDKNHEQQAVKNQPLNPNECCKVCKHTDRGKKACVCVVPLGQRRTILGGQGCQTCRCKGCSIEDFVSRGQDPIYKVVKMNKQDIFDPKRLCCKKCMKAFYNKGKPCFCQLPSKDRKGKLPSNGCQLCNCRGCNTQQYKGPVRSKQTRDRRRDSKSRSRDRKKKHHRSRSSSRRSSSSQVNVKDLNLNNFDKSILGAMIINQYRIFPGLLGFGIPQRTQSYIMNKPK